MFVRGGIINSLHIEVAVIDTENDLIENAYNACRNVGIRTFVYAKSLEMAESVVFRERYDIVFLEMNEKYRSIWNDIRVDGRAGGVLVGSTYDRSGKTWLSALKAGADRVLIKQQAASIIEPMLMNIINSEAARRFRIVPFHQRLVG